MFRKLFFTLCVVVLSSATAVAEEKGASAPALPATSASVASTSSTTSTPSTASAGAVATDQDTAKQLRGMSVLGNNEAPMSLFIVPWKSSELGVETDLSRNLNERDIPVDRDVFLREVQYYEVSVEGKPATLSAVVSPIGK